MPNQLANETSPYLLQHANNPVDWRPWSAAALEESKATQKPIFLSIGYSACHWCHVMEHESFENAEIAAYLNEHFISIKVDREERPDLDQIYMSAVQLLTGRGGWPMSVFLTPDLKPFYGGTYWPPVPARGMPGFLQVLKAIEEAWRVRRDAALQQSEELTKHIREMSATSGESGPITPEVLRNAVERLNREFDPKHGGFGTAPKFPHAMDLQLLLRMWSRSPHPQLLQIVETTLDEMRRGGIYDHLAGGFARYSVDEKWLVPHFEKMLYDNALLMNAYLDAYLVTGKGDYARVATECGDYLLTWMADPAGGFHSTEDADSEGEEGKFYVWSKAEIHQILGAENAGEFCEVYGVTDQGNFEGHNILHLPRSFEAYSKMTGASLDVLAKSLAESRQKLLEVRNTRIRPGKDDKVLTSWNALAISALARLSSVLEQPRFLDAARGAADFLIRTMRDAEGNLLHTYRAGVARQPAFLDDYAYLVNALIDLFEADGEARWINAAIELADKMRATFEDSEKGGFYYTSATTETLITRQKDSQDQSVPSGNGMAATALIRLATFTGNDSYLESARKTLECFASFMSRHSLAAGQMLIAADWFIGPRQELVLTTGDQGQLNSIVKRLFVHHYSPRSVRLTVQNGSTVPSPVTDLANGKACQKEPTLFVCENFSCQAPAIGLEAIGTKLKEISSK